MSVQMGLLADAESSVDEVLLRHYYLGPSRRASLVYRDDIGVLVFAAPASRRLPRSWVELARWCILDHRHGTGTQQWSRVRRWLIDQSPATTVVSYSDPSVGHTGTLYRAAGWLWAPTWHRLRTPPTKNGAWAHGKQQAVKDRWVYPLRPDASRPRYLEVKDEALIKAFPWASYREPRWKHGHPLLSSGGADYQRWTAK